MSEQNLLHVQFLLPFQIPLPDTSEDWEPLPVYSEPPCSISTYLHPYKEGGMVLHGRIEGADPYGRSRYSEIIAAFREGDLLNLDGIEPNITQDMALEMNTMGAMRDNYKHRAIELAVTATNRLIDFYRAKFMDPLLHTVRASDIMHFKVFRSVDGKSEPHVPISIPNGFLATGNPNPHSEALQDFRKLVGSFLHMEFILELDLQVRRHIELGEYRFAVIFAALQFEYWIKELVKMKLTVEGKTPDDIRKVFWKSKHKPHSVYHIATKTAKAVLNVDFEPLDECEEWSNHCKNLRNDLIHGTRQNVTKEDATRAKLAIDKACVAIISRFDHAGLLRDYKALQGN